MSSNAARVTVGLPVYNGERYLEGTIESIVSQTCEDFELVISDNASIDSTGEICSDYAAKDPRIRYFRSSENHGLAWNHNFVVEIAQGSLFKWVGADDICLPEYLARCLEALDEHLDAVLAYPRTVAIDEHGNQLYAYSPGWELLTDSPPERLRTVILMGGHWVNADSVSGVIRIDALRKTRLMTSYLGGDKRTLGELSLLGKFIEIPEHLLLRRFHPQSSGKNNPSEFGYDKRSVEWIKRFFKGSQFEAYMPSWVLLRDHLVTIWSSSLPFVQKLRLTTALPRTVYWYKQMYLSELLNLRHLRLRCRAARSA